MSYGAGPVLDAVNLRIRAGETVAVVGHTGSGKSTLVGLVPRLMDPTDGAVLLDGMDLRRIRPGRVAAPNRLRSARDFPLQRDRR